MCSHKISDNRPRTGSTIDKRDSSQTCDGQQGHTACTTEWTLLQCRCPGQDAWTTETGTRHHRVPTGRKSLWRPIERFAPDVEGDVVGRESAFRNGRRRRVAPHRQAAEATETPQRCGLSPAAVAGVGKTDLTSSQAAPHTRMATPSSRTTWWPCELVFVE